MADPEHGSQRRSDQPNRLVSLSALAAGPMSKAVERMAPMASDDRPTAAARATMNSEPTSRTRTPRAAAASGLSELRSSGRKMKAISPRASRPQTTTTGTVEASTVKIEPNRICWVAPVTRLRGRVEIEEQGGEAGGRTEHDAGGQVAAPHPLHPDEVHGQRPEDPAPQKPVRGLSPSKQAPEPPAVETSARECPAKDWPAQDGEHAHHGRDDGDHPADDQRRRTGALEKNPGSKSHPMPVSSTSCEGSAGSGASASRPGPATTMTRPCTLSTST